MTIRNLDALFRPKAIALVGASNRKGSVGAVLARNLFGSGFNGPVMPVNPHESAIRSSVSFRSVADLPVVPDLAVIATPAPSVPGIVAELGQKGCRAAVVVSSGFHDRALTQAMLDAARPHLMRIVGPNCIGYLSPGSGINASFSHLTPKAGDLAFVSQSGAIVNAVLDWADIRAIGFSHVVSIGDTADVDLGDLLDMLALDAKTRAILLFVESIADARKFMTAARIASRTKPVVVIKAGRSEAGAKAVAAQTGAPIGEDAVYDAAFRRAGMLRVGTLRELFEAVGTLASGIRPKGDRLAIVTNGAGAGVLAADALIDHGGTLAMLSPQTVSTLDALLPPEWARTNPIDMMREAPGDLFRKTIETVLKDPAQDAVLVLNCPQPISEGIDTAEAALAAHESARKAPLLTCWLGERAARDARKLFAAKAIPTYQTPDESVRAFMQLVDYQRNQDLLMETPPALSEAPADRAAARAIIAAALDSGREELGEDATRALLAAYGLRMAEAGAVARTPEAVELMAGARTDPVFGPVLVFGQGGNGAAPGADRTIGLPPLNPVLARDMIHRTRIARLLDGTGEGVSVDRDAVAAALVTISQMLADFDEIAELAVDPLLADASGVVALSARVCVRPASGRPRQRFAIQPYPGELARRIENRSGKAFRMRPIRPEDEPGLVEMVALCDPNDVRLRFFAPMKRLGHAFAARLTQIDYSREMAFVMQGAADGEDAILGVARLIADPDGELAEFGIMVRSDQKGLGLGYLLMNAILDHARREGIRTVYGEVLAENTTMLAMARGLGFRSEVSHEDPGIRRVTIDVSA